MQSGAGVRTVIEDELRRAGVRVRDLTVAMELGLQESAKSAVEAGHGVCFLSSLAVEKELRLGTLATAEVAGLDPARDFYSVRLATRSRRRLTDAFLAWCRERLAADFGATVGDFRES
jgi:DNA-binding transcriptional LysR family regulator